ncbi:MAG: membrane protein insertase YidC [Myxococcales bacterium]|jgi:YidC/Oxa1 family membrane protein insertase
MDQQKRLLLAIVLSTAVMFLWMQFFSPPPKPAAADAGVAQVVDAAVKASEAVVAAEKSPEQPADAPAAPVKRPEQRIQWSTPAQELEFTNQGGGLSKAIVKGADSMPGYKFEQRAKRKEKKEEPVDLARVRDGQPVPGASEISGDLSLGLDASYDMVKTDEGVVFTGGTAQLGVEKRFEVNPMGYDLRARYSVTNRSNEPKKLKLAVVYPAWLDPKHIDKGSFFAPPPERSEAVARAGKSVERLGLGDKKKTESFGEEQISFVGFDQRYFLGALFPTSGEGTSATLSTSPEGEFLARLELDLGTVAPGQTVSRDLGLYIGPKSLNILEKVSAAAATGAGLVPLDQELKAGSAVSALDPRLDEAIDFGWWAAICRALLWVMKSFQGLVSNWGLAIILLTVLVKLLLYPLSHKQMESMEAMRRLQPQMNELAKKYEGDNEKLNLERMRLFQENKVNPFGGCLPLIIQMPVWFALYTTLQNSFELYREPLLSPWVLDLTRPDPFFILPLAMGVTMFITQKMQPQMGDPTQAKIMLYVMPIFFTFIMLNLPAGLTLYIFTNNLLSIAQQKWLQRKFRAKSGPAPTGLAGAAGK